jgi:DNA-directed RNA polymerase subunit L
MSKSKTKSTYDVNIKIIEQAKIDETFNNYLVLQFSGTDINHVIMNTIRRVIMELVPTYAFDKDDILISKNTSIYNNDYMKLRLSHFPIIGIENLIETIKQVSNLEYEANISTFDQKIEDINIIAEKEQAIKLEKAQNFIININVKNTTANNLSITTDNQNVKYYYQTKPILSPYKQPLLIIKLKPGEEFIGTLTSTLNIGLKNSNYMPTAVCVYSEENENSYKLNIESLKQLSEIEIIIRSCDIILTKLNNFLEIFKNKIKEYSSDKINNEYSLDDEVKKDKSDSETITESAIRNTNDDALEEHRVKGIINIENETHTFGNLLSRLLQEHPAILFAGYKMDHLLIKILTIGYKTDGTDIIVILDDVINKAKDIFDIIKNKINKL